MEMNCDKFGNVVAEEENIWNTKTGLDLKGKRFFDILVKNISDKMMKKH